MIAAIIQARMGSTRLPGKVLIKVNGVSLLEYQINRVKKSRLIDKVIVATSDKPADDPIDQLCRKIQIDCFRGSENDVLTRYYECAKVFKADTIVRLTGDCPLSDPRVIDSTIELFENKKVDYAANTVPPETSGYPDGFDVEIFSWQALERAFKEAEDPHDREHVTFYFWKHGKDFTTAQLPYQRDLSKYRFTIDYPEDLQVMEFILEELGRKDLFGHLDEITAILDSHPEIKNINSKYFFGIGWQQKIKKDGE